MPSSSAARITSMPLGTVISKPSMVTVTRCSTGASAPASVAVIRSLTSVGPGRGGGGVERAAAPLEVLDELVPEVLDGGHHRGDRAVAERAERAPADVVADVEQLVQVLLGALAALQPVQDAHHPVRPLPARGALAAGLVLVELGPPEGGAHHAGGLVEDLQRPGAEHGPGRADGFEVERDVDVLVGEEGRGGPAGRPELQRVAGRTPPARSSSSRRVTPSAASYWPGMVTWPLSEKMPKPLDRSVPSAANGSAPCCTMYGTLAIDSTLLTTVGQA